MDKAIVERFHALGYKVSKRKTRVMACKGGSWRQLGTPKEIAAMSKEELQGHLKARFATPGWSRETPLSIPHLTERRMAILRLVAEGLDNKEIAARVGCGDKTAGKHVGDLIVLFGLRNRTQLVIHAIQAGLIDINEIKLSIES